MTKNSSSGATARVAMVGCGYWGKNVLRNFSDLGALAAVSDANPGLAEEFAAKYGVPSRSLQDILSDPSYDGVAFATPAELHVDHVSAALNAGKHVFVEKPLALEVSDGVALADLAKRAGRILMVGHLLQYHPLLLKLLELSREDRFGKIRHAYSNRLNLGKVRLEEDVVWSFAPHDISVVLALLGEMPRSVSVKSTAILNRDIADIADINMDFSEGVSARIFVSWLNPFKEQKLVVIGERAQAVFDDTLPWNEKLTVYDHKVVLKDGRPEAEKAPGEKIIVDQREPLREECSHFLDCIARGATPRTDSAEALRVLSTLDAARRSSRTGDAVAPKSVVG